MEKKGSCFTIALEENPNIPLGTYHASDLTPYQGSTATPIYPLRKRGRPKTGNNDACANIKETEVLNNTNNTNTTPRLEQHTQIFQATNTHIPPENNNITMKEERKMVLRPRQSKK